MNAILTSDLLILLLASNLYISTVHSGLSTQKLMVKMDRLELCYLNPEPPNIVKVFYLKYTKNLGYSLDFELEITRDWENDKLWGYMEVERCASREALDTCEPFAVLKPPISICQFLSVKGMGIGEIIESFVPPYRCPFKKGTIVGKGVVFNPDLFTMFPITGYYWKINGYFGERKKLWVKLCAEAMIFHNVRSESFNVTMN